MSTFKRIDPNTFPEIARKHGITPCRGNYVVIEDGILGCYACAVGMALLDAIDGPKNYGQVGLMSTYDRLVSFGFTEDYCAGLDSGWEGENDDGDEGEEYMAGSADGRYGHQACVNAGLIEAD